MGKTKEHDNEDDKYQDHPHLRGENQRLSDTYSAAVGSSPLAWGKLLACRLQYLQERIIPTCVGKTRSLGSEVNQNEDHPHLRGENNYRNLLLRQ